MSEHRSCDGFKVEVGKKFWSNDLRVVRVIKVASHSNDYRGEGTQTWHDVEEADGRRGSFDTLDGRLQPYGRLVRFYEMRDAELYDVGTYVGDVK